MKKRFLFALGIVLTAASFGLTSCGDDDDEPKTMCTCSEYDPYDGKTYTQQVDPATFAVSNCAELADKFNSYDTETYMTCK